MGCITCMNFIVFQLLNMGTHGYTCEYSQGSIYAKNLWVPVDPWAFDSRIWVIRGRKSSQIWVWSLVPKIPMGTDPGHPQVHSCPALGFTAICKKVGTARFRSKQKNLDPRLGLCHSS